MENCFHVLRWALKTVLIHNQVQMCIDASKGVPHTSWPKLASFDMSLTIKWTFFWKAFELGICNGACAATYEHVHMSMYIQICTYESIHTNLYLRVCTYKSVPTGLYTQVCTYHSVRTSLYTNLCQRACTYKCVCTNLYTRACTYESVPTSLCVDFSWCCPWKHVFLYCVALSIESGAYT